MFLTNADFYPVIKQGILDEVTEADNNILNAGILIATEEIQSYLNQYYDVAIIFAQTGTARNPILVMYATDITLYHIHARINPRYTPDVRKERYENAINWLKMVAAGKITPDLPRKEDANGTIIPTGLRLGSMEKFNSDF